jgi:hypothetical protein
MMAARCVPDDHLHVYMWDADEMPTDALPCLCGAYTWGFMNRKLAETETLEAMWQAS